MESYHWLSALSQQAAGHQKPISMHLSAESASPEHNGMTQYIHSRRHIRREREGPCPGGQRRVPEHCASVQEQPGPDGNGGPNGTEAGPSVSAVDTAGERMRAFWQRLVSATETLGKGTR
jgi:hypothetical protein